MSGIRSVLAAALMVTSVGSAMAAPPGWKTVVDKTGVCQLSVPANWVLFSTPGAANSPVSTMTAVLAGSRPYRPFSDETLKMLEIAKLYENSPTRSFYVTKPAADSKLVNYHVEVAGSPNVCIAQISLPASYSEDEAKNIALTLKSAK